MKIGDLATASSTAVDTIRYYEREGLLPAPGRTQGGFRVYEQPHLERLQFIRYCRGLDMSLDEVRALLRVKDDPSAECGDVNALLDAHIGHVSTRIRELRALSPNPNIRVIAGGPMAQFMPEQLLAMGADWVGGDARSTVLRASQETASQNRN